MGPDDCEPNQCVQNQYRKFVALKGVSPNFKPMLSIGKKNPSAAKNLVSDILIS